MVKEFTDFMKSDLHMVEHGEIRTIVPSISDVMECMRHTNAKKSSSAWAIPSRVWKIVEGMVTPAVKKLWADIGKTSYIYTSLMATD